YGPSRMKLQRESAPRPLTGDETRAFLESVKDYAIFALDPDGRILTWNEGARVLKGYTAEEAIGTSFTRFYPPEDVADGKPQRLLQIALAEGRYEEEGWRIRKGGERFWASAVLTAVYDHQGVLRGFSKVTRDLTERRRAEELLRQSEHRTRLILENVRDAIF